MNLGTLAIASSVIALVNVLTTAKTENITLKLSPTGTVYLFTDNWPVNFTCALDSKGDAANEITSSNLTFYLTRQEIRLPDNCTIQISSTKLVLKRCPEAEAYKGKDLLISCRLKHDKTIESDDEAVVTVYDQHPPPEILIAEAEVFNWDDLTFTVNTRHDSKRMFAMTYSAWVRQDSAQANYEKYTTKEIGLRVDDEPMFEVTVKNPFQISDSTENLIIKVNGTGIISGPNGIQETVTSEEILNLNQFVKPAQVNDFQLLQLESSVTVSFEPPKPNRNITYNIVVKCNKDLNDRIVNVTREINGTHCRISKEFTDLPAFSNCSASVRAIPVVGGIWSDWKRRDFETPEGIPRRNPEICSNCFSIRPGISDSVSDVIVYFSPLSEEEAQGKIILYKIRIFDKSFSNESFQYLNNTENSHYSFVLRNLSNHNDYEIGIEAKTSKGYNQSPNMSSLIEISPRYVRSLTYPMHFVVLLLNDTAVRAIWDIDKEDCGKEMKISLFWCEGIAQSGSTHCAGVLRLKSVPSYLRSDIIAFSGGQFIFGIGTECNGKSSGILWNECVYDLNKDPSKPDIHTILWFDSGATIFLANNSACSSTGNGPGLTVVYRITYRKIPFDNNICLIVSGLNQNQRYRLSIQSLSENSRSSPAVIHTSVTEKGEYFNADALLSVAIVIPVLLVIVALAIVALKYRAHILNFKYETPGPFKSSETAVRAYNSPTSKPGDDCSVSSYNGAVHGHYQRVVDDADDVSATRNELYGPEKFDAERNPALQRQVTGLVYEDPVDRDHFLVRQKSVEVVMIPGSSLLSDTQNCRNLSSEAIDDARDTSGILPSVFGSPSEDAVKTDTKVTADEQQRQPITLYEHQEPSAEEYSPPTSEDYDEYMCVAHGNPESSKLENASVPHDSEAGYIDGSARVAFDFEPSVVEPKQPDFGALAIDSTGVQQSRDSIPTAVGSSGVDCVSSDAEPRQDGFYSAVALENCVDSLVSSEDDGIDSLREGSMPEKLDHPPARSYTRHAPDASMQPSGSSDFDDDPDLAGIDVINAAAAVVVSVPESVLPVVCFPMLDEYCSGFRRTGGGGGGSVCSNESQSSLSSDNKICPTSARPKQEKSGCDETKDRSCPGLSTTVKHRAPDALFTPCNPTDCGPVSGSILPPILL